MKKNYFKNAGENCYLCILKKLIELTEQILSVAKYLC